MITFLLETWEEVINLLKLMTAPGTRDFRITITNMFVIDKPYYAVEIQ